MLKAVIVLIIKLLLIINKRILYSISDWADNIEVSFVIILKRGLVLTKVYLYVVILGDIV